jgi:chaperone required for assembly of F1-ATPase
MKRFYKDVASEQVPDGFQVLLDGKAVKTPARQTLLLPTMALAQAIEEEWRAQGEEIVPASMPMLRLANTAQDGVAATRPEVIAAILRFGEHDLVCYRAESAAELLRRQREGWDPMLEWAAVELGAPLTVTEGIGHAAQPPVALAALERAVATNDVYGLVALHVMSSITGSLVLGLALARGAINPAQAFHLSRLDEIFQAERWGKDPDAEDRAHALARELDVAANFLKLSRPA